MQGLALEHAAKKKAVGAGSTNAASNGLTGSGQGKVVSHSLHLRSSGKRDDGNISLPRHRSTDPARR